MSVGRLTWRIVLDSPAMVHCGSSSPISGSVVLGFAPTDRNTPELFGPMQLSVALSGRAKSKIWESNGQRTATYRGRAPLTSQVVDIHEGSLKLAAGEEQQYPFVLYLPDTVDPHLQQAKWCLHQGFDSSVDMPLPPSMYTSYRGFSNRFECFVEYRIQAMVAMRQIDVKIVPATGDGNGMLVYYQPTRISSVFNVQPDDTVLTLRDNVLVKNKYLLPEDQRPSGFMQHAKNFFADDAYPTFTYNITVQAPLTIHLNQLFAFEVASRPDFDRSNTPSIPMMRMVGEFEVQITADTKVRAEGTFTEHSAHGCEVIATFVGETNDSAEFTKANDYTKTMFAGPLIDTPSAFSTFNITRTYNMSVSVTIETANKTRKFSRQFGIKVLPPVPVSEGDYGIGSSRAGPSSQEAEAGVNSGDQLPEYQPPPLYDSKDAA